ncbi:MAG: peptide chain release factor 1 [Candidatus Binatia bacterium]|nr:MAG: peptide chain release factor 1 [Candidatus Binatia bacterium]
MVTAYDIEKLLQFDSPDVPISSFYLDVDGRRVTPREYETAAKDLIKARREETERSDLPHAAKASLKEDFRKLEEFVVQGFARDDTRGLAVFSCSAKDFWQVYRLPRPVKNAYVIGHQPYVRPLTLLLDEYHRFGFCLVSREKARIFEFYLGEVLEHTEAFEEVPGKVKVAGWYGLEERRIERHIEDHVRRHLKATAEWLFREFRRRKFDYVILGGKSDLLPEFERFLHRYVRDRIVARLEMDVDAPVDEVRRRLLEEERRFEERQERVLVAELEEQASKKAYGIAGLEGTLQALAAGAVRILLVDDGFTAPGRRCPACGFLSAGDEAQCPICREGLVAVSDIVNEAIEEAYRQGGEVEHVLGNPTLERLGHIGALLRFPLTPP